MRTALQVIPGGPFLLVAGVGFEPTTLWVMSQAPAVSACLTGTANDQLTCLGRVL